MLSSELFQTVQSMNKTAEKVLVSVAWPYANGPFHVGHLAGAYVPADIFARFQRLRGHDVLMVSGSDCHGTPITLKAESEGVPPQEIVRRYHDSFLKTFCALGISFDLFTQTYTDNHYRATTDIFKGLLEHGYLYRERQTGSYSESLGRFLPDRFVEGTCPHCSFTRARGDQCDSCGRLLEPSALQEPRSSLDKKPVTFRETEHYVLDLAKLEPALLEWLHSQNRDHWRPNTLLFTENWLKEGLRGRAITRDLEWGVPVPVDDPDFRDKRIYVWFDAVIGYYSASIEWAHRQGQDDLWKDWWVPGRAARARSYYFVGKDNIPFHSIIWPAMLLGYGGLNLPYDVPANEFLNLEGEKMSTSRNWALWAQDIQERYSPDAIRFYLAANAPEGKDASWSWADFVARNNNELVANWGNLANRVLNIAHKNFGEVPKPGEFTPADREILDLSVAAFDSVGKLLDEVKLRPALQEGFALSSKANQYLAAEEPWKKFKTDPERAATIIYVGIQVVNRLKVILSPFLPFTSQKLNETLGFTDTIAASPTVESARDPEGKERFVLTGTYRSSVTWEPTEVPAGQKLGVPAPLFQKLEESVGDEELARLRAASAGSP